MKIQKGDNVFVIAGKNSPKKNKETWEKEVSTWKVLKVFTQTNKVIVEGINIVTKHIKKNWTQPGKIIKTENPIDVSNVMLVCPYTSQPTRVGYVMVQEKTQTKKYRFSKTALKAKGGEAKSYIIK